MNGPKDPHDPLASAKQLLFGDLFFGLRKAGLAIGLSEWMTLMEALDQSALEHDLPDFYAIARSILVKTEAHFDTYDQVFVAVFGGQRLSAELLEHVLTWLNDPREIPSLSEDELSRLDSMGLDTLRKLFEERIREQKERHDGGNRWVGTGGTSPFGHGGAHPSGVRVGGSGGGRSAIQIATARRFREYRNDRILDTRALAVALKKLRRLSRREGDLELDIDDTIERTCRNAGELELAMMPPRKNEARVILMMDQGGSMEPFARVVEQLFSAASSLNHWRKFEAFVFHNCVYSRLEMGGGKREEILTADILKERPEDTFLIMVGDALMAPSELIDVHGAIDYGHLNTTPGLVWLHRLRARFPRAVWLNPIPETGWYGWTIKLIGALFPMHPLTLEGLESAVDVLRRRAPDPLPDLGELYRQLR